jgi:hypothetical protein
MHYELVSRALAYVSCLSTLSLFMTSVAIAAINVGNARPAAICPPNACLAGVWYSKDRRASIPVTLLRGEMTVAQSSSTKS